MMRSTRLFNQLLSNEREVALLTNHQDFGATTIAGICKDRLEFEPFLKALKQNLKVKTFVGTTENALQIRIWTAGTIGTNEPPGFLLTFYSP